MHPLQSTAGVFALLASFFLLPACDSFQYHITTPVQGVQRQLSSRIGLAAINGEKPYSDSTNYNFIGLNTDKSAPYVPSGLTPEQYQKIKEEEAAKISKMNFGAWGPRFKQQTEAPEGDWMVQTNLWTRGFQQGRTTANGPPPSEEEMERQESRRQQLVTARTAITSFLLAYLVLDILLLAFSSSSTTRKFVSSLVARQGILQAMRQHLASSAVGKLLWFKFVVAGLSVPWVSKYREDSYRKLWPKRRTFGLPLAAALLLVGTKMALGMGLAALLS